MLHSQASMQGEPSKSRAACQDVETDGETRQGKDTPPRIHDEDHGAVGADATVHRPAGRLPLARRLRLLSWMPRSLEPGEGATSPASTTLITGNGAREKQMSKKREGIGA